MKFPGRRRPPRASVSRVPRYRAGLQPLFARRHGNHPDPFRTPFLFCVFRIGKPPLNEGGPASVSRRCANLPSSSSWHIPGSGGCTRASQHVPHGSGRARPCAPRPHERFARPRLHLVVAHVVNFGPCWHAARTPFSAFLPPAASLPSTTRFRRGYGFMPYQANAVPPV